MPPDSIRVDVELLAARVACARPIPWTTAGSAAAAPAESGGAAETEHVQVARMPTPRRALTACACRRARPPAVDRLGGTCSVGREPRAMRAPLVVRPRSPGSRSCHRHCNADRPRGHKTTFPRSRQVPTRATELLELLAVVVCSSTHVERRHPDRSQADGGPQSRSRRAHRQRVDDVAQHARVGVDRVERPRARSADSSASRRAPSTPCVTT